MTIPTGDSYFINAVRKAFRYGNGVRGEMFFVCYDAFAKQPAGKRVDVEGKEAPVDIVQLKPESSLCDKVWIDRDALR